MAGAGSRFANVGYKKPKPFIDVNGKPMIARVLDNLYIPEAKYILVARKEHIANEADSVAFIKDRYNVEFIEIDHLTEGMVCTVLYAHNIINNETPLLLANSDQLVDFDINYFIKDAKQRNLDGSILTFIDHERNPKWSYVKTNSNGIVTAVKEKEAISDTATVGVYFYSKGSTFVSSSLDMIVRNDRVNNEFYTCPTYNYAIKNGNKIGIYNIDFEQMHGIGTPEDLNKFIGSESENKIYNRYFSSLT